MCTYMEEYNENIIIFLNPDPNIDWYLGELCQILCNVKKMPMKWLGMYGGVIPRKNIIDSS